MDELIKRLKQQAGLTDEQALKAVEIIKNFTKEKFPLFSSAIDKAFNKYSAKSDEDFMP